METKTQSRVLIVDDMRVNRMILSSLLASHGVLADMAESGEACLALCRENRYDLILLDHRMPGADGIDTLVQLKEIFKEQGREVPVICHTVETGKENINLYKAAGFADVLIKPVHPQNLSELLMKYLPGGSEEERQKGDDEDARRKEEPAKLPG
ncbi:MAG: response regulator [Schwartzia sp.]|nr:response regulator [Schwartzia sp. (in: firmicutes)]